MTLEAWTLMQLVKNFCKYKMNSYLHSVNYKMLLQLMKTNLIVLVYEKKNFFNNKYLLLEKEFFNNKYLLLSYIYKSIPFLTIFSLTIYRFRDFLFWPHYDVHVLKLDAPFLPSRGLLWIFSYQNCRHFLRKFSLSCCLLFFVAFIYIFSLKLKVHRIDLSFLALCCH